VPEGLTEVIWEDWLAATRLAMRQARAEAGPTRPIRLIGFSNGGALALQYALDAMGKANLARPDRMILISPMVGITEFARFVGLAALPAVLPAFSKAAWLSVVPKLIPSSTIRCRLTIALQTSMAELARAGGIQGRRMSCSTSDCGP
jgi:alpha-beta hydrolase superfamily lysophospholipase